MPFLLPNKQSQNTEGNSAKNTTKLQEIKLRRKRKHKFTNNNYLTNINKQIGLKSNQLLFVLLFLA